VCGEEFVFGYNLSGPTQAGYLGVLPRQKQYSGEEYSRSSRRKYTGPMSDWI